MSPSPNPTPSAHDVNHEPLSTEQDFTSLSPHRPTSPSPPSSSTLTNNTLSDIYPPTPPLPHLNLSSSTTHPPQTTITTEHPSDLPRLRTQHYNAGYLEGITLSKAGSVQEGFDEGFQVGARAGLRAGWVRGVLEGIARVSVSVSVERSERDGSGEEEGEDVKALLERAKGELVGRVVMRDTLRSVLVEEGEEGGEMEGEGRVDDPSGNYGEELRLKGWEERARKVLERWGLDLEPFATGDVEEEGVGVDIGEKTPVVE
ncbi:MAG: Essential protein Yae1, N terminal [Caeruleum heppii]|nr:MAG: Essential protein Yae1, N terminal [Caeruleum heppii]